MASIRIHQDQENRVHIRQKQTGNAMAVNQKRAVLGVIDNNKLIDRQVKGKQALANLKEKKQVDLVVKNNDKLRNLVNPVVPCAQFEAFKVYEDSKTEQTQQENARFSKIKHEIKQDACKEPESENEDDVFLDVSTQDMSVQSISSPMKIETVEKDTKLAEDINLRNRCNKNQFFEVEEYRPDIYMYLREHELKNRPKPLYMKKQPDINHNMRTILVDWLVEVAEEYKLSSETLYLAVNFIDRFLSYMSVVRAKLQLVGTAAMFIASKYEEIYPPDVSEFVYITDDTYNKRQVIRMEHLILKVLGFDLSVPTPLTFITAICVDNEIQEKVQNLAMYLSELGLLEAEPYLEFLPSTIAAASVAIARHTFGEKAWNSKLTLATGYELIHLKVCMEFLQSMFVKAPEMSQHAIQDKYKSIKYLHVSQMAPNSNPICFDEY